MTSYRLMDGQAGRPGAGPSTPVAYTGNFIAALGWAVLQGGCWFEGYWIWCCNSGQSTTPVKCALWYLGGDFGQAANQTLIPEATATSGTLTAGAWNYVAAPQPVQLSVGVEYLVLVGINQAFAYTVSYFNTGDAYPAGVTNGPLNGFSGQTGTNPGLYGNQNGLFATNTADPAVSPALGADSSGDHASNFWVDAQVNDQAPDTYRGSYRLWPNNKADSNTNQDAAANYIIATEIRLSRPCVLNRIWFYSYSTTAQLPTAVDIWRIQTQTSVAGTSSPSWSGAAGSGWISCSFSGVTLGADAYKVSVYNGTGSPSADWSSKRLSYWGGANLGVQSPGLGGISNGPMYAPPTPLASPAYQYNASGGAGTPFDSSGLITPGQCTFATGPPDQWPYLYVGGPGSSFGDLFQNYWVDMEVTPIPSPGLPGHVVAGGSSSHH